MRYIKEPIDVEGWSIAVPIGGGKWFGLVIFDRNRKWFFGRYSYSLRE